MYRLTSYNIMNTFTINWHPKWDEVHTLRSVGFPAVDTFDTLRKILAVGHQTVYLCFVDFDPSGFLLGLVLWKMRHRSMGNCMGYLQKPVQNFILTREKKTLKLFPNVFHKFAALNEQNGDILSSWCKILGGGHGDNCKILSVYIFFFPLCILWMCWISFPSAVWWKTKWVRTSALVLFLRAKKKKFPFVITYMGKNTP